METVTLRKKEGQTFDFQAHVQPNLVLTDNVRIPVEEGDVVERGLANGMVEKFEVLDRGFYRGLAHMPDHYQMKVRRVRTARAAATVGSKSKDGQSTTIYNVTGPNARVNVQSTDNSTNFSLTSKEKLFAQMSSAINENVADEAHRLEFIQSLNELKAAPDGTTFGEKLRAFRAATADYATILGPFLPVLLRLLADMK